GQRPSNGARLHIRELNEIILLARLSIQPQGAHPERNPGDESFTGNRRTGLVTSTLSAVVTASGLFAGMLVCLEAGFRLGRHGNNLSDSQSGSAGTIDGAIFGLLGLLLGFSFAVGLSRLDARRDLLINEVNAIGTAYLRLELLPPDYQPEL